MASKLGGTEEVITLFRRFDADRDGCITRRELASALAHKNGVSADQIPESRLDEIMRRADKDRDGVINYEEFATWIIAENQPDEVVSMFRRFDANGDGVVSREELRSYLARKNNLSVNRIPEFKIDDILAKADKDGDGFIDYEEFVSWILGENAIDNGDEPGQRRAAAVPAPALRQAGFGVVSRSGQEPSRSGQDPRHLVPYMHSVEAISPRDLLAMFERFDANKDGAINKEELRALLSQKLKVDVTEDQMETVLAKADRNRDGKLNYQEFVQWMLADSDTPSPSTVDTYDTGGGRSPKQQKPPEPVRRESGRPRPSPLRIGGSSVLAGGPASPRAQQVSARKASIYPASPGSRDTEPIHRRDQSIYQAHPGPLAMFQAGTSRLM